jgi:phospho-N-acetylmuramoyl-pentapeptide-transferase
MITIFFVTCFITLFFTNFVINIFRERNIRQFVLKEAPKTHMVKQGTPTMGGIAMIAAILLVLGFQINYLTPQVISVLVLLVGFGIIGAIDDLAKVLQKQNKGLTSRQKLLMQIGVASIFAGLMAAGQHIETADPLLRMLGPWVYYPFLAFIVVGASNAVNLTDGLDGLAAGNLIIAFLGLFWFSFLASNYPFLVLIIAVMAALGGFLWFNVNPARIFMGDTGSLSMGAVLAGTAICLHKEFALILLGIVFVAETLSVILQVSYFKMTKGKRIFKMSPLHHHFELSGWTENKVVLRFWMVGILALLLTLQFA